jgi:hypothetical protein
VPEPEREARCPRGVVALEGQAVALGQCLAAPVFLPDQVRGDREPLEVVGVER